LYIEVVPEGAIVDMDVCDFVIQGGINALFDCPVHNGHCEDPSQDPDGN
jgi:hypothetical protein